MHLAAYDQIRHCLSEDESAAVVSIPLALFRRLLRLAAHANSFDEAWYTTAYEDVAEALEIGKIESGLAHFADGGYFEGRRARVFDVDEEWYLGRYPDIAAGVLSGAIASGHAHYNHIGYSEGRVPVPEMEAEIEEWNQLIANSCKRIQQLNSISQPTLSSSRKRL